MIRMICYDITEDKVRNKLADLLEYQGFERIQYSVFVGQTSADRWKRCWRSLKRFFGKHCEETDRIYTHVIPQDHFRKMLILSEEFDQSWILNEIEVLFL